MKFLRHLYVQVIIGILIGGVVGILWPDWGVAAKPVADGFIKLIRMLIGPLIFATVVVGLAGMGDLKKVGRVGFKSLLYFEVLTTLALVVGLTVANVFHPGTGFNADPATIDTTGISQYTKAAQDMSFVQFLLHIIPNTFVSAFVDGDLLQVLLLAVLFGFALTRLGDHARPILTLCHEVARVFFGIVSIVTKLAPLAAGAAIAFTLGKFGVGSLVQLGALLLCMYLTCAVFIVVVLGTVSRMAGFSLWRVIKLIREEILIVIGTSSSESALPGLMEKLEKAGCSRSVVGLVVPSGYSFNLDGTCIYLTLAALFIAQATNTPLTLLSQLGLVGILLFTSKGAAGVTGSGFITLAATLQMTDTIPIAGLALILGVDRFLSEARAVTNFIGNAVATLVVARWDHAFDAEKGAGILARPRPALTVAGIAAAPISAIEPAEKPGPVAVN